MLGNSFSPLLNHAHGVHVPRKHPASQIVEHVARLRRASVCERRDTLRDRMTATDYDLVLCVMLIIVIVLLVRANTSQE